MASVNLNFTPEQAQKQVLDSVAPFGPEYTSVMNRAFNQRWIDLLPTDGKHPGGYSSGTTYDVHPYLLTNFTGNYSSISTLAHELGHSMHFYLSNKRQPYPIAYPPSFVIEVASTFNEILLMDHLLRDAVDDKTKLSLLGNYLETFKGTLFQQTQFAEFELRMHEMAQTGQPIVGDALAKLYLDIARKYYGHDRGICIVDDYMADAWSNVPHFYMNFYVFKYATSFTASIAVAEKVNAGDPTAIKRFLAFLSSGGSKYPIDLLKDAGIDMTTDEPLDLTVKAMNQLMDEMERLLAKSHNLSASRSE